MRFKDGAIGDSGLKIVNGRIYEEAKRELVFPQSIQTFKTMLYDVSVATAVDLFLMLVKKPNIKAVPPDKTNEQAVANADFINWMLDNLEGQSFSSVKDDILSYSWAGFSMLEKVFETIKQGKYEGLYRVKSLEPRPQASIDKWLWDKETGRKLKGVRQNIQNSRLFGVVAKSTVDIPISKLVLFSYRSTKNNPEGRSPLLKAYVTWKFKCLFEDIEGTGISKDMSGVLKVGLPRSVMVKAISDPASEEGILYNQMFNQAQQFQNGDQACIVYPIDYTDSGKELYNISLMGVDGGKKNHDLNQVIQRRKTEILMAYFADLINLGNDSHGSFSLADSKTNLVSQAAEEHLSFITHVLQKQLVDQLAVFNEWNPEDTPKLVFDDIEGEDVEVMSKAFQQIWAVGAVEGRRDEYNRVRKVLGLSEIDGDPEEIVKEPPAASKAGEGMKEGLSSGTGKGTGGGDKAAGNRSK
jgi:hypothetical protein